MTGKTNAAEGLQTLQLQHWIRAVKGGGKPTTKDPETASVRMMAGEDAAKLVAGHSLRAGYCTEAATVGLQPYQIREQTGHRSDVTLARYIRPVAKRKIPSLL